jgi:hypothetical protein
VVDVNEAPLPTTMVDLDAVRHQEQQEQLDYFRALVEVSRLPDVYAERDRMAERGFEQFGINVAKLAVAGLAR